MTEYGPLPFKSQVNVPAGLADAPGAWIASIVFGCLLLLLAWRLRDRTALAEWLGALGGAALLTCPLVGLLPHAVYGDYPTIDKQGSILFYLDGVHVRAASHPLAPDAAARLIGVHLGHLWVAQAFDSVLEPFAAFNAEGLLWLVAGWACASAFMRVAGAAPFPAFVLGLCYGLGLHAFRDLNWYTVEKTATFGIPLYGAVAIRALRGDHRQWFVLAAVTFLIGYLNLYFGMLVAMWGAWGAVTYVALTRDLRAATHLLVATLVGLAPLAVGQALLMRGGTFASPECFLRARASLDVVTLWPPAWNRLELWRACHPVAVCIGGWAVLARRRTPDMQLVSVFPTRAWLIVAAPFAALALGPTPLGASNPIYWSCWYAIPFFWRVAKPEMFFFVPWLVWMTIGAIRWTERGGARLEQAVVAASVVVVWFATVRLHPVYPGFSEWQPVKLPPGAAERRLSQNANCPED